jgi:hypothetical protein
MGVWGRRRRPPQLGVGRYPSTPGGPRRPPPRAAARCVPAAVEAPLAPPRRPPGRTWRAGSRGMSSAAPRNALLRKRRRCGKLGAPRSGARSCHPSAAPPAPPAPAAPAPAPAAQAPLRAWATRESARRAPRRCMAIAPTTDPPAGRPVAQRGALGLPWSPLLAAARPGGRARGAEEWGGACVGGVEERGGLQETCLRSTKCQAPGRGGAIGRRARVWRRSGRRVHTAHGPSGACRARRVRHAAPPPGGAGPAATMRPHAARPVPWRREGGGVRAGRPGV